MAKRRMLSQELIADEEFNSLSIEAQNLFIRMLTVSDDYGVIPSNYYTLITLTNPPDKVKKNIGKYLGEITGNGIGIIFNYEGKEYFMFKRSSFDRINSYVLGKRTKSEFLRLEKEFIESENFQEILRNSTEVVSTSITSTKFKVISNKFINSTDNTNGNIEKIKEQFIKECKETNLLKESDLKDFIDYWTEPNQSKSKLKYQLQKTWDTKRRMGTWLRNKEKFDQPNGNVSGRTIEKID